MKNYHIYQIVWLLSLITSTAVGQDADTVKKSLPRLTLREVISAIDKNPTLQIFEEKINANNAYAKGARSLDAPKLSGGLWMYPYKTPGSMNGSSPENQGAIMIGAEQMIMNSVRRKAEQSYMDGMSAVDQTMKSFDRQNMIEMAKKIYYEWVILEKQLSVIKESTDLMETMIKSGEIAYTYNQGQLNRIYKAKSELYKLQNMQVMIESEIRMKNIELNIMMNRGKQTFYSIDTSYVIQNYEVMKFDTSLLSNRSDVQGIEQSIKLFELKKNLELSKRSPDFGIKYDHMNNIGGMPNQFNLMGMVSIPIAPWASKGYKANINGIKFETAALNKKREAIMNQLSGEIQMTLTEITGKKKQLRIYQENIIPSLQKYYNTSLIAFEHMKEDLFMTIDALMALKMAQMEYFNVLGDLLKLQAKYERQIEK